MRHVQTYGVFESVIMDEKEMLVLAMKAFHNGSFKLIAVGPLLVPNFGLLRSNTDLLVEFALKRSLQGFARVHASLRKLPGTAFSEPLAD